MVFVHDTRSFGGDLFQLGEDSHHLYSPQGSNKTDVGLPSPGFKANLSENEQYFFYTALSCILSSPCKWCIAPAIIMVDIIVLTIDTSILEHITGVIFRYDVIERLS